MRKSRWARQLVIAMASLLASATQAIAVKQDMTSEFGQTCVASKSIEELRAALRARGWKLLPSLAQSHLAREIAAVGPMLEAQGLTSNYTVYSFDDGTEQFELAVSETVKPIKGARKLVGCSLYDFHALVSIDMGPIRAFAPAVPGERSVLGDVQAEIWKGAFGERSDMRAVFVPPDSPMKDSLGFTGMMLGTVRLDDSQ